MIEVYRIPVPKDRLQALSPDERVLLLLLGYVSNQVLMLQKLLIYATRLDPKEEVEQHATAVQTQMLVRIAVSAAFEAWRLIETRFLSNPMAKDYLGRLDKGGLQALDALKKHFGKSALLPAVRNNFGFHYPDTAAAEAAFQAAANDAGFDDLWKVYFSQHGFNSLFLMSDAIFTHGIAAQVGETDLAALQQKLMDELREASMNVVQFAQAFFAAAWVKHFGDVIDAQDKVKIEGAPPFDKVILPFFVEVDPAESAETEENKSTDAG
jgi:hypothetical protein